MHAENGSLKCIGSCCSEVTLLRAVSRHCVDVLSLGPHFCYPIPSFDKSTGDGTGRKDIFISSGKIVAYEQENKLTHENWPHFLIPFLVYSVVIITSVDGD